MKLLPLLDFETICARPKILVGFSDITALLVAIYNRCGMVTFHGPLVTTLKRDSEKTCLALIDAIGSSRPLALKPRKAMVLNPGWAYGRLVGGNLTSLCHLMGTPYEPPFEGHLLFLEDREKPHTASTGCFLNCIWGATLTGLPALFSALFRAAAPLRMCMPL